MKLVHRIIRSCAASCLALVLAACGSGGNDGGGGSSPPAAATIGPAGGTVTGPNGGKIEIPPGALTTDTAIAIALSAAGAPALPPGFTAHGQMFAFIPHGTCQRVCAKVWEASRWPKYSANS